MDNLVNKLTEILGSEEGKEKLAGVASMLGADSDSFDLSKLSSILDNKSSDNSTSDEPQESSDEGLGIDIDTILKITTALSSLKTNNKNTSLIKALKPHIKDENRHKIDEALQIMQLVELFPAIKDMGIFDGNGILGGLLGGKKDE
jgi:hypothetical protein